MSRVKKIKNEKKLASFEKALPSVFATSSTKKIIRAASKGNLEEYGKTFKEYNWARTRDYNCVLLIFSPIVAAARAIINEGEKRDSKEPLFDENEQEDEKWVKIINLLNKCLSNKAKLSDLCEHIGSGKGKEIEQTLRNFQDYNNLIGYLVYGNENNKIVSLIERAKRITPWKVNGKYIRNKLIPFVNAINPKLGEIMKKSVLETQQDSNTSPATSTKDNDSANKLFELIKKKFVESTLNGMEVNVTLRNPVPHNSTDETQHKYRANYSDNTEKFNITMTSSIDDKKHLKEISVWFYPDELSKHHTDDKTQIDEAVKVYCGLINNNLQAYINYYKACKLFPEEVPPPPPSRAGTPSGDSGSAEKK